MGLGGWRAIQRFGVFQNGKVRGIDDALRSKHNAAAYIAEAIHTAPPDMAVQVLMWSSNNIPEGSAKAFWDSRPALGGDDLKDAYHGVPTCPCQLPLCGIALRP